MTAVIPRDQAVAEAGALMAADRTEMHETYQREGAMGVARRACPGGDDAEIARLARMYDTWVQQDRAKRRRGAA